MLSNAGLRKEFSIEAVNLECYLVNQSPNWVLESKTPEEIWSSNHPSYEHLRVFGCPAYVTVKQTKPEPRAIKHIFLDHLSGVK